MQNLTEILQHTKFHPILPPEWHNAKIYCLNMGIDNSEFADLDPNDTAALIQRTQDLLTKNKATLAIGRYGEQRSLYQRSELFNADARSVHLGIDLMLPPGTAIHAPLAAKVHSYQDNNDFGDYGPTIILQHQLENLVFYTLYGHLSRQSLKPKSEIEAGKKFATIGDISENGGWPPHLHLQIIQDLEGYYGDYPGVANPEEAPKYLANCPDPMLLLNF